MHFNIYIKRIRRKRWRWMLFSINTDETESARGEGYARTRKQALEAARAFAEVWVMDQTKTNRIAVTFALTTPTEKIAVVPDSSMVEHRDLIFPNTAEER